MKLQSILIGILCVSLTGAGCQRMTSPRQAEVMANRPAEVQQAYAAVQEEDYAEASGLPVSDPGPPGGNRMGEVIVETLLFAALFAGVLFLDHELKRQRDRDRAKLWRKYKKHGDPHERARILSGDR